MATASDLGHQVSFRIGTLEVRPATCEVIGARSRETIEPRVMQVLVALAEARGETVTRDDLSQSCWGGRVVGNDAINRVIHRIRQLERGVGAGSFELQTIPKVGYRLVEAEPVVRLVEPAAEPASGPARTGRLSRRVLAGLAALLVVAALAGVFFAWPRQGASAAPAAVAVLPFSDLSNGDPYLAEGVAEEIRARLAQEPQFRIAGRTSSRVLADATDLRRVGRALGMDYVLEGSVRSAGGQVRVNAALVKVEDDVRLWSASYDGRMGDVLAIQRRIGEAVAAALERKLLRPAPAATSGDSYNLYLAARSLIRSRHPTKVAVAVELLERTVAIDPNYAPAWASLGAARLMILDGAEAGPGWAAGRSDIERALRLAPDLAEAHAGLALADGSITPKARAHIRRAAQLDPRSAEIQFWLGHAFGGEGRFEAQLRAYRRAVELDPLWDRGSWILMVKAWRMGDLQLALDTVARFDAASQKALAQRLRGHLAFERGDFSQAAQLFAAARAPPASSTVDNIANYHLVETLALLGDRDRASRFGRAAMVAELSKDIAPSLAELRRLNRIDAVARLNGIPIALNAKLLLNAGQAQGLAREYDGEVGLLGLSSRGEAPVPSDLVESGPTVAMVLRASGGSAEADRLLAAAERAFIAAERQGRVPVQFRAAAAQIWATQGKRDKAMDALEQAFAKGWVSGGPTALRDIGDEPAFRSLRGHPRFEHLRARIGAHLARERRELDAIEL